MTAAQLPASPPSPVKAIRFEKIGESRFYYGVYEILTGRAQVIGAEKVTEYPESGSTPMVSSTHYTYNGDNLLTEVTDTLADGSTRVRKMKYAKEYSFPGTPTQPASVALKALKDTHRHGELIEQTTEVTVAGGSPVLTDASLVTYKTFSNGKTLPANLYTVRRGSVVTPSSIDNNNVFSMDPDYYSPRSFNDYDSEGRVLWESDDKENKVAHSYSTAYGYEAATFANTGYGTSVHEGFETATTAGLTVSGGTPPYQYPAGWTGEKALELTSSLTLTSTSLSKESATTFRISCWAKASAATTVYFKAFSGTLYDIGSLAVDNSNQWKYYEAIVTPATVPSNFTLKVTASGTVTLDDIIFIPAAARVALQTAKPLVGVTSATDDRGNSVVFAYDAQGRKIGAFDRKRNLIQKMEYANQKSLGAEITAGFTTNATAYKVGTAVTYTALDSCSQGASPTYAWIVDGTTESTSNQFTRTMTVPGRHNIRLEVTKSGIGTAKFNQDICFELAGTPDITAEDNQSNPYQNGFTANCNTPTLTFTANNIPTGISGCTTTITWRVINYIWVTDHYEVNVVSQLGTGTSKTYAAASAVTVQAMVQIDCTSGSDLTCLGGSNFFILGFDINWETINCN
jgi:YD repeat-containing protein